jgi:acetyl-CoA acyltransferase 1
MEQTQARRLNVIANHLNSSQAAPVFPQHVSASASEKRDDDVVIVACCRTAICKAKRGAFKDTHWTELLVAVLKGVVERGGVSGEIVEDVQVGTVLAAGGGATEAKMAAFAAGYPDTVALASTNRQCSSGLQAVANIAAAIRAGYIKVGVAAGVESMSTHSFESGVGKLNPSLMSSKGAADCLIPMGITSENVAAQNGITREYQDAFAAESQQRAAKAQAAGHFKDEILPVSVTVKQEDGTTKTVVVDKDEGIRATTAEQLAKLRPAFKKDGTTTAGNSSQVSDGAAAVLMMTRAEAKKRGLKIIGKFHSFSVVGVPPSVMGIGPAFAIPPAVKNAGLTLQDIDVYEINEAFASQATYSVNKLGLSFDKVNPLGGAIALGHPLGCTGARQVSTLLYQLHRTKQRYGVCSMCIGTGMGAAGVFEAEF